MTLTRSSAFRLGARLTLLTALLGATARLALGQAAPQPGQPLTLGDAARLAARQSAGAQIAELRVAEAEARVRQARAALFPEVSGAVTDGQRTFNTASFGISLPGFPSNGEVLGPVRNVDLRARGAYNIYDPARSRRINAARVGVQASSAEAASQSELAAQNAAGAYLRVLRTEAQVVARTADSALAAELVTIAQNQLQAGVGVGLDVTRAQAQLANTRAQILAVRNDRDRARLELIRALDLPVDAPIVLADSLGGLAVDSAADAEPAALERALRDRPDVRAAEAQARAARAQISAIRAERLPSLGIVADEGLNGLSYSHLLNTYSYGLQVSVPIFEGFAREGRVEAQTAVVSEAEVRLRDLRLQAQVEVRAAVLDIASAREQTVAARERLRLAEQELSQARERFQAGVAGSADVITASLLLNQSRNLIIDAQTGFQLARLNLARAEGSVTSLR
jgi:outer membrane protein TolC